MMHPKNVGTLKVLELENSRDHRAERNLARAAEHLVCSDILSRGLDAFLVGEGLRYDLIAEVGGALRRIQVKSTGGIRLRAVGEYGYSVYRFKHKEDLRLYIGDVDLFAFVALDRKLIVYVRPDELSGCEFRVSSEKLTPEFCDASWSQSVAEWMGG